MTLSNQERIVVNMLTGGGIVRKEDIIDELWGWRSDGGPLYSDSIVKTLVCQIRKKLGIDIKPLYCIGYYIGDEPPLPECCTDHIMPRHREILDILSDGREHSIDHICGTLGFSNSALNSHIWQIRQRLADGWSIVCRQGTYRLRKE